MAWGRLSKEPGSQGGCQPRGRGMCSALWGPKAWGGGGDGGVWGGQGGLTRTGSWTPVASEEVVKGTWEQDPDPHHHFPRPLVVGAPCPPGLSSAPSACPRLQVQDPPGYRCLIDTERPLWAKPCRRASSGLLGATPPHGGRTHFTDEVSEAQRGRDLLVTTCLAREGARPEAQEHENCPLAVRGLVRDTPPRGRGCWGLPHGKEVL